MIKSLPIENILPKESLSSKKSVKTEDSSFKKVLDKTFKGESRAKHSSMTDNIERNTNNKEHKTEHKRDDKPKSSSAPNSHMFVASQKTGNTKTGVKSVEGSKKKSLKSAGKFNGKRATIGVKKEKDKNVIFKKIEQKSVKNGTIRVKENPKIADFKVSIKDKTKLTKTEQASVKNNTDKFLESAKIEGEKRVVLSKAKTPDSLKNVDKTMSKKGIDKPKAVLSFKETKTDEKTQKKAVNRNIADDKNVIVEKKNVQSAKNNNVHKAEVTIVRDGKKTESSKRHGMLETNKKDSVKSDKKKVIVETSMNIEAKNKKETKYVSLKTEAADTKNRKDSVDKISDGYTKRLNIKEVKVAEEDNEHTKKEVSVKLNSNKPNGIKGNTSQTVSSTENAAKNFDSQLQTVVNTVQKQNKTVKIETLKNVKNNKIVKVVSFDVEDLSDSKQDKPIGGHYTKALAKDKAVKFNVHINNKAVLKNPVNMKAAKDLLVSKLFSKGVEISDTKKNKDAIENALSVSAHNLGNTHTVDIGIKNLTTHYPMDKIIENIDKMMKMKPPFNNTVTIKLEPPHIGVLELRMKMDKDRNISAFITAQDKDVVRLINTHTDGLKTYLNSQGIKVAHIDVHNGFNEQPGFGGGQNQGTANGNQQSAAGGQNFGSFGKSVASGEFSDTPKKMVYKNKLRLAGVDITV